MTYDRNMSNSTAMPFVFEKQFSRLQNFWVRGTDRKTKLMSTMWHDLTVGDGLFGALAESPQADAPTGARNSWTLDSEAKQKVWSAFRPLLSSIDDASYSASLTPEMLDIAYEQYIVHHHSITPLIHLPSFCPRNAPVSLLVAMCTIGLSVMGTGDLNKLVSKIFPVRHANHQSFQRPLGHIFIFSCA